MSDKNFHSFRSEELEEKYRKHKASGVMDNKCVLCAASALQTFKYWKIMKNDFPYDLIAKTHHMILPIRHVKELDLTEEERLELLDIKANFIKSYDCILESTLKTKTIPEHHHLHLLIAKKYC